MRVLSLFLIAVAAVAGFSVANAQVASTTRIETQPVYGATVTYESGVRVFRPIPPTGHLNIGGCCAGAAGPGVINQQAVVPTLPRRRGIQTIPAIPFPQ
jgi:hypothetical protein